MQNPEDIARVDAFYPPNGSSIAPSEANAVPAGGQCISNSSQIRVTVESLGIDKVLECDNETGMATTTLDLSSVQDGTSVVITIKYLSSGEQILHVATRTISKPPAPPTVTPVAGMYFSSQTLNLSASGDGTTVYYTTDGTTPTTSSNVVNGPVTISSSTTLNAIAVKPGFSPSAVTTNRYTILRQLELTHLIPNNSGVLKTIKLSNGNIVVSDYAATVNLITAAGSVSLYDGTTGALISTITGSRSNDMVGYLVVPLTNGNFVIGSYQWSTGTTSKVGAATWCSGTTGCSGTVDVSNSLVGSTFKDQVGEFIHALPNGNYLVGAWFWDSGTIADAGALTWCDGSNGRCKDETSKGAVVSVANSLVGSTTTDHVGSGVTMLNNGNFVTWTSLWDDGEKANVGAATFCSGTVGCKGTLSLSNSFIGNAADAKVGTGVTALTNGNYVIESWNHNGDQGAVTWCDGTTGCTGVIDNTNSLRGSTAGDAIGLIPVVPLTNGNYLVPSPSWDNGATQNVGALTWCSGTTGICAGEISKGAVVSINNSLIGSSLNDSDGINVTVLSNGNYVSNSRVWDNNTTTNAGAVTWCDGTAGCTGAVSISNSLYGTSADDLAGAAVQALSNGNYVVATPFWNNGATADVGAATWCSGTTGICKGETTKGAPISATNSLTGTAADDKVGYGGVTALANGNYVVSSQEWANGTAASAGAVTFCPGTTGCSGQVTTGNSLTGSKTEDYVGGGSIKPLANGNYVVISNEWNHGAALGAGAVTWCSGSTGICKGESSKGATVSSQNSLTGSTSYDDIGTRTLVLDNGNYVVGSPSWDLGGTQDSGAITWCSGSTGCSGPISSSNSLLGASANDKLGLGTMTSGNSGLYICQSTNWNSSTQASIGLIFITSSTAAGNGIIPANL